MCSGGVLQFSWNFENFHPENLGKIFTHFDLRRIFKWVVLPRFGSVTPNGGGEK